MRKLPAFVVIGAQKAGTTALRHVLAQHPQIYLPTFPEPAFFAFEGGAPAFAGPQSPSSRFGLVTCIDTYAALFAQANGQQLPGDISSHYSYCWPEQTAACMYRYVPNARVIAILRQPADRAYSAYNMMRQKGLEPLDDFVTALATEESPGRANWTPDFFYRRTGMYAVNLAPYFDRYPAVQIRVFLYEEWTARPAWVVAEICQFLGLDEYPAIDLTQRHRESLRPRRVPGLDIMRRLHRWATPLMPATSEVLQTRWRQWYWSPPPPMPTQVRQTLTDSYREDIQQLQGLLHRDLGQWLMPKAGAGR